MNRHCNTRTDIIAGVFIILAVNIYVITVIASEDTDPFAYCLRDFFLILISGWLAAVIPAYIRLKRKILNREHLIYYLSFLLVPAAVILILYFALSCTSKR